MTDPSSFPVAALPVLGVEPGHVAEAKRALAEQGRVVGDDAVARLLWAARALPAALDVIGDAQSGATLGETALGPPHVDIRSDVADAAAILVAIARIDDAEVVIELVPHKALFLADGDDAAPACVVTIPLRRAVAGSDIAVHRFTIGPPA